VQRITGRPLTALSPQDNLEADLNLSSLDRVELLSALEDRYQTDLSEAEFSRAKTIGELQRMLQAPPAGGAEYPYPRWAQRWPVALLRNIVYYLLVWPATHLLAHPRVTGRQHLRGLKGPVLVVANHVTEQDIGFVLAALPARFRHRLATAMFGERLRELRHPPPDLPWFRRWAYPLGYLLVCTLFNVFSMPKQSGVRRSFQYAGESVDRGYSILVFPEGQLTRDGRVGPFRAGIGILAQQLGIPVVPMKIDGLYALRQAGRRSAPPNAVRVTIAPPIGFQQGVPAEEVAARLQRVISTLA
jgi:long-chain acyl-CoA synthetase